MDFSLFGKMVAMLYLNIYKIYATQKENAQRGSEKFGECFL